MNETLKCKINKKEHTKCINIFNQQNVLQNIFRTSCLQKRTKFTNNFRFSDFPKNNTFSKTMTFFIIIEVYY